MALDPEDVLTYSTGPLLLLPRVTVSETFSDNVFYDSDNLRSDLISTVSPGITLKLGRSDLRQITLSYDFDQLFYLENSDQNAGNHGILLETHWEAARIQYDGRNDFRLLSTILEGSLLTGQNSKVDRALFNLHHRVGYDLGDKAEIYGEGEYREADYSNGTPLFDRNTLQGTLGLGYQFSPKTSFFGEGFYGQGATDPNTPTQSKGPHSEFVGGFIGARGDFTARLTGEIKAGYESRTYSDGGKAPSEPIVETELTYLFSAKTRIALEYTRRSEPSVLSARQSYVADRVRVSYNQMIGSSGKLFAVSRVSFQNNDYEQVGAGVARNDQQFVADVALVYQMRLWLSGSLGYRFEKVDTNLQTAIDYQVNQVNLSLTLGY